MYIDFYDILFLGKTLRVKPTNLKNCFINFQEIHLLKIYIYK